MPNVDFHLRVVQVGTFMTDCDVEEMFLNFALEPSLRLHTEFNLSSVFSDKRTGDLKGWWGRMIMGFGPSPYLVTKDMMVVEERARGTRLDPTHIFRWCKVILNLPGMEN